VARVEVIRERMNSMRSTAHDNICAAQETQKRHYDVKRRPPTFSIGDRVYHYNRRHDTRKGGKLATRYDGPFVIAEVLGKGSYRLEKPTGSPVKVLANSRDLKPVPSNGYASPVKNSPGKSPAKSQAKKQTQTTRDVVASDPVWISALNLRQTAHQQRAVGK